MTAPFKAAAVQFEPHFGEKTRNLNALLALVEEAASNGAKLITTPEMGTTGYCWYDRAEVAPFVETIPGPSTDLFVELARRHDCYIVIGLPEVDKETNLYYNSAALIGPDGVVGVHRKTHPYISEPKWAASGDLGHKVFETKIGRIAMLICMDIHFIETARLAGLGGADVICHISNWLAERTPAPYWISRAHENGCYLMESNRWGLERGVQFSGGSCIIAPDAEILDVVDDGDGIAYGTIDPARARQRLVCGEPVMTQRRPDLYMELMTNTFSWNPRDFFSLYGHQPIPEGRPGRIAVGELAPSADIAENLRSLLELAEDAKTRGAELVVFPALALTGSSDPAAAAIPATHDALQSLKALSDRLDISIVAGFAEKSDDALYSSAVITTPNRPITLCRQIHLTESEQTWAKPGHEFCVLDLSFGRIGIMIGHDAAFPETARILALRGCDLICCPSRIETGFHFGHEGSAVRQPDPIPFGSDPVHWHHYRVRAGENNCYLAFANTRSTASNASGLSGIFGPDTFAFPRREAIIGDGALAVADIDLTSTGPTYPTNVARRKDLVLMRQPHHYTALVR
ncbi:amidohydrolase [Rhizobium sp. CG5]|uniref:nitrilase-related carbon-nitrogen hydrolase n=1 Tax=Rhizobium sp. CG5 TaxID=2726076 RepID=UPI0020333597|nr:nitrilase-related carbon-nitrogen hydrolase [Rhizobium sp. CG5]MCM2477097.1 amidohydrolase [Rhizobium sp. CG5]